MHIPESYLCRNEDLRDFKFHYHHSKFIYVRDSTSRNLGCTLESPRELLKY